ncbi:MAG: general secretion pathway protein GspE [Myxococcales bacterium]|nr:general secretion pathway protein GspE [Myxococcales bacterium]
MEAGVIDELQLKAALSEQRKWGGKLGRTLVEMGFVKENSMVQALCRQLNLPVVDLDTANLPLDVVQLLRLDVAERYGVFPLGGDKRQKALHLATADPTNFESLQELSFSTGMKVQVSVSTASGIDRAIRRYYYGESTTASATASPSTFGVSETTFDPELISRGGPAAPSSNGAPPPEVALELRELAEKVVNLERLVAGQVRALRGMLELLVEKGVLGREEYLSKVRRE